ncbi:MAG: dicarboxylate/amino acid:cation symporter [Prevotellaceae bacterium]|nr:dicarboxylate/amino acid:cation symporter [Prevotellaceae bacterium]
MENIRHGYGLLIKVIVAIALGVAAGWLLPLWAARVFLTFNALFSEFLGFMIPLIIVGLVTPAIAELGRGGGRMLLVAVLLSYGFTLLAGLMSYTVSVSCFPSLIASSIADGIEAGQGQGAEAYFTVSIPPLMSVMTALCLSFTFGLGIAYSKSPTLRSLCLEARAVVERVINRVLVPLLPLYIFGIFLEMTAQGEVARILRVFAGIILVIFAMHILWLLLLYSLAGALTRRNPLRLLLTMLPAYFTALGTQSSAATIPVTLRQTLRNGVSEPVAGFVVPLCATIHLSGSMLKIVACALALMIMQGLPYGLGLFAGFICLLAITMVAAPGVPGGAIMAALGVLASVLGFGEREQALMIALYIAMDCFGTACNVTGDGAIALLMQRIFAKPLP